MSALIEWGVFAIYVAGLFPATVRLIRWHAGMGSCHREDRSSRCQMRTYRSWCAQFHQPDCWRPAPPDIRDLRAAPGALIWPVALLALVALTQARKQPTVHDLQKQIADLEAGLGIGDRP